MSDGAEVAIKVARSDQFSASERLLLEAAALQAIGRPFVPDVFEVGHLPDGAAFVVMEFIRAPTLAEVLTDAAGPLPREDFFRIAPVLASLVGRAHDKGFLHGDLKPENVFITPPAEPEGGAGEIPAVRLFDFGLVRRLDATRTSTGEELPEGTPDYMSPEQCEGGGAIDARSDIYSLGVMLYEMVTGAPPFWGKPADVQMGHRSRRPLAPSRRAPVEPAVEGVILRCLAKDPARRFATGGQLEEALRAAFQSHAVPEVTPVADRPLVAPGPSEGAAPAKNAKAPAAADAGSTRERRVLALVFVETKSTLAVVRETITMAGGELAHMAGTQVVVAFGHEVGDNPTRAALRAAQLFLDRGLSLRAYVDLGSVAITIRKADGSRRYQSPLFAKKDQYPTDADPEGIMLARAAADVLPDVVTEPVARRPDVALVKRSEDAAEATAIRTELPHLVGRDEVLRALLAAARQATTSTAPRTGTPTISTVIGEPGAGKSHLASVLAQHVESIIPPLRVVLLRAKEALGGAGDQTTRDLFRRFLELPATSPPEFGRALLAERLGPDVARETWAGVAVTMGWASPDHPELRALAAAPGALRAAAARAAGEALRAASRKQPVALLLEDAQFADETALDALEYATLQEAACPLWVLVLGRPSFGSGRTAWSVRAAVSQRLELPALDPAAAAELARRLLAPAENVPASAVAKLVERTQGLPLLLVELVRGLKRDGIIRRSAKTGGWFLATDELDRLPDLPLVQWLAGRETESLPPDLAGHARLASILGAEFDVDEMDGVVQTLEREGAAVATQLDAGVGIERLVGSGLLVRHRQGRVGFRLALMRDTLYRTIAPAERETTHRAAYRYFAARTALADEARLPKMAAHAALSGLRSEAAGLYLDLALRSERRHSYLDAESLFRQASDNLGDTPDDPRMMTALQGLGTMRFRLGRHEDALKDLAAARASAQKAGAREREIEIVLDESLVLDWVGDWSRSGARATEAEALATAASTPLIDARLVYARGRTFHRANKPAEAIEQFEKSAAMAEALGTEGYETHILSLSLAGWNFSLLRRFDQAEDVFARLIATCEQRSDMLNLTVALNNRCILSLLSKNSERLLQDIRRLIVIARETGLPLVECSTAKDLGEVQYLLGESGAEEQVRKSIEVSRHVLGRHSRGTLTAELLLARVLAYRGDLAGANQVLADIRQAQAEARTAGQTDAEFVAGEELFVEAIGLSGAAQEEAHWADILARAHQLTLQPQDVIEMMELEALSFWRGGQAAKARAVLETTIEEASKSAEIMLARLRRSREVMQGEPAGQGHVA
jgi:tetratricopeptide (TPR) repeat protein